jgi:AMME syndrome candidate gene 1 protein
VTLLFLSMAHSLSLSFYCYQHICVVVSPHYGGPRDFLDDMDDAVVASATATTTIRLVAEEMEEEEEEEVEDDLALKKDDGRTTPTTMSMLEATATAATAAPSNGLEATDSMCFYCFDILIQELQKKTNSRHQQRHSQVVVSPMFMDALPYPNIECPLFVTWEKQGPTRPISRRTNNTTHNDDPIPPQQQPYELRGCIGSLSPKGLLRHLREYAVFSAFQDPRFDPITIPELAQLRVSVSLLIQYEACRDCYDWIVGTHGVIIKFDPPPFNDTTKSRNRHSSQELSATFLPEVARQQHWDQTKTIQQLIRKAGYNGAITEAVLQSIECTRYQSSKYNVTFQEYNTQRERIPTNSTADTNCTRKFIEDILLEGNNNRNHIVPTHKDATNATPSCHII